MMRTMIGTLACALLLSAQASAQYAPPQEAEQANQERNRAAALRRLFAIVRREPSARDVQRQALRHYQLEPQRINRMVAAARLKGLLPEVEGSFDRTVGDNFSNTRDGLYPLLPNVPDNPNPNNFKERTAGGNSQDTFRLRVVLNLDRIAFNAEALDARALNSIGENLLREVTTLYFSRRRLIAGLLLSPPTSELEMYHELMRLDELTATLNGLTGGNFADRAWNWSEELELLGLDEADSSDSSDDRGRESESEDE